jgi:large subunit ribosomal protein L30
MDKKIKITQHHSVAGRLKSQKLTAKALGLNKRGHSVIHNDTPAIRGMVASIQHLVTVEELGNVNA